MLIPIRTGEPSVMTFVKRAKILATRVYEFFEGGNIDHRSEKVVRLVRQTSLSSSLLQCAARCQVRPWQAVQTVKPSHHPDAGYLNEVTVRSFDRVMRVC
jgi:hypothetical protein